MSPLASASLPLATHAAAATGKTWVHLVPTGTFVGRDGRGPYRLGNAQAVIEQSRRSAGRRLIPIDYDHAIDRAAPNGREAPAAGWIKGLQSRTDGIWGLVEWTARAAAHIANREYRYLSPVFHHTPAGDVTSVLRAALLNNPNLDQLTALASAETTMDDPKLDPKADPLAALRELLQLPPEADMTAVIAKVRELLTATQSAGIDPAEYVPIGDFERAVAEINRLNQGVSLQAAQDHVAHQVRAANMPPFLKDWGVALCSVNKPAFDAFIERTGGIFNKLTTPTLFGQLPSSPASRIGSDELAMCARMGISEGDFLKARAFRENAKD